MKKLLVVFNTCGISRESPFTYSNHIRTILNQSNKDFHLAVSSCMNSGECLSFLVEQFKGSISYNSVNDALPVSVTFNDTVEQCVKQFGEFEQYMFIDSGIDFSCSVDVIDNLLALHESGPYAMTSARTDDDMGLNDWFGTDMRGDSIFVNGNLVIPVGKAVNLHVQIFSNEMLKTYNRILPDIFAGQCMESVFSFMCAAINKKWIVHKNIILNHKTGMDGPSSGFSPAKWMMSGKNRWDHLFMKNESIVDIINRGYEYGMGYEEIQKIAMHDPSKYNDEGYAKSDKLKEYIRDNLYLSSNEFDYSRINRNFIP
jgi:hypothetical protein